MQHSNEQSNHFFRNLVTAATAVGAMLVPQLPFMSGEAHEASAAAPMPGDRECHSKLVQLPGGLYQIVEICEEVPVHTVPTLPDFPRPERVKARQSRCVPIAMPSVGEFNVNLNVAVADPSAAGYATVYKPGADPTKTASINYAKGETKSNGAQVEVDAEMVDGEPTGAICVYTYSEADIIVDVGSYSSADNTQSAEEKGKAVRVFDSREKNPYTDGNPLGAGQTVCVDVGHPGELAVLNAAVDNPAKAGFLTIHSSTANPAATANANFNAGETTSNSASVIVGKDGKVCATPSVSTEVILDLSGFMSPDSFKPFSENGNAVRLVDSRTLGAKIPSEQMLCFETGEPNSFVDLNVAVTEPEKAGFFNAHRPGEPWGMNSSGNYSEGETTSNRVITQTDSEGKACITSNQPAHFVVDANVIYKDDSLKAFPFNFVRRILDSRTDPVY